MYAYESNPMIKTIVVSCSRTASMMAVTSGHMYSCLDNKCYNIVSIISSEVCQRTIMYRFMDQI